MRKGRIVIKMLDTNKLCMTPDTGLTAPEPIFVAVRAIAPVAGIPPNNGVMIFAIPWPNNSSWNCALQLYFSFRLQRLRKARTQSHRVQQ